MESLALRTPAASKQSHDVIRRAPLSSCSEDSIVRNPRFLTGSSRFGMTRSLTVGIDKIFNKKKSLSFERPF
jgi:hypothetical protein